MTDSRPKARRRMRAQRKRLNVVGVLGELLITAGVLVFLFLGWQLWLNDIVVGEQHRDEAVKLTETWDNGERPVPTRDRPEVPEDYGDPIVPAVAKEAEQFAVMYIPRFGDDWVRTVSEGISLSKVLNRNGIGRYPDTQLPGEVGNFAVAAHRTTYGAPFKQIAELQVGDKIYVRTPDAYYTYVYRNTEYVWPTGVDVKNPLPQQPPATPTTDRILTMTACHPMFSAAERIIAYAVLESWQPADAGPPAELAPIVKASG